MKLKSMTDYVLEIRSNEPEYKNFSSFTDIKKFNLEAVNKIFNYSQFLKQPLTLGMFVPCDEDGSVLEEPFNYNEWCKKALNTSYDLDLSKYEQYQQAKERVLIEGFKYSESTNEIILNFKYSENTNEIILNGIFIHTESFEFMTIESLVFAKPTLTPSAIRQL